jgi:hypothetical protein
MDTVEIVNDIWQKAQQFMHQSGTLMGVGHIGKEVNLYLIEKRLKYKVSSTYICQHDLLCRCGAELQSTAQTHTRVQGHT